MRTLIVIPARLAATRLRQKPLRHLGGRPLVVRVWERVSAMELADRCVVATDHRDVAAAVKEAGAECVMTAAACRSGTERVAEVLRRDEFSDYELIANVQGDEPFIGHASLKGALDAAAAPQFEIGTAAVRAPREILDNPDIVKVVATDDGRALYFSRGPIPFPRHRAGPAAGGTGPFSLILQHVGVYAYRADALRRWVQLPPHPLEETEMLEQLRPLAAGMAIGVAITDDAALGGIDTEEDLARANERWAELSPV